MSSTPSPSVNARNVSEAPEASSDKISAYYSLVFPNITYYLQTLTVTIGRRCLPAGMNSASTSSDARQNQVDVDLGPLKSVSRLHAKIEWHAEEERFMLVVIGKNGAWIDGVWSGSGSKVALGARYVSSGILFHPGVQSILVALKSKLPPAPFTLSSRLLHNPP
jgi:forkhead box protein K